MVPLYLLQHFLSALLLDRRLRVIGCFCIIICFIIIQLAKNDSYDIYSYEQGVLYSYTYEPLFQILISLFKRMTSNARAVVSMMQISLCLNIFYLIKYFEKKLLTFVVIISSVFFYLSINNAIRQGFASSFILLMILQLMKGEKRNGLFLGIVATFLHYSSPFFIIAIFMVFFLDRFLFKHKSFQLKVFLLFILSIASVVILKQLILYTGYYDYLNQDLSFTSDRTPLIIKLLPISLIVIISELLISRGSSSVNVQKLQLLRIFFLSITISCSMVGGFDELGARILFFHYAI